MWLTLMAVLFLFLTPTPSAWAQMGSIEGNVKDENGNPIVGGLITLDRKDIKAHYEVKTDKKGALFPCGIARSFL